MSSISGPVWTKRARLEGRLDPLGLDRPSDRLTAELIPGVSVNVNLARYFALFPWLFATSQANDADAQYEEIVRAEKAYALGAILAHAGERCAPGIAGSDLIGDKWNVTSQYNLDRLNWLSNGGVYVALYKGPLFKLGLLKSDTANKVVVTEIGRPVAEAFGQTVSGTAWAQRNREWATITRVELHEFGERVCPCSLKNFPTEQNALRRLFFDTPTHEGRMLAHTLGFILLLLNQSESFNWTPEAQFRMAMYYRQFYDDDEHPVSFQVSASLDQIVGQWRLFQAHDYFSFALETLLTLWLECMEVAPGQRLTVGQFLEQIETPSFFSTLNSMLGINLKPVALGELQLSTLIRALPEQAALGEITRRSSEGFDQAVRLGHSLAEQNIADSIWKRYQQGSQIAERCAEALALLIVLYVRFYHMHLVGEQFAGWRLYGAASAQTGTDLGLPRFYWWYPPTEWPHYSVYDWLAQMLVHQVVQQALDIRDERGGKAIWFLDAGLAGMGKLSPLTQVYQFQFPFDNYRMFRNTSKLGNALALLDDIGYTTNEDGNRVLTDDGRDRLRRQFGG